MQFVAHDTPCLIYQGRYNLLDREAEKDGMMLQAQKHGAGFICFSPLAQGLLAGRYLNGIPEDSRIAHGGHLKKEALSQETLQRIKALNMIAVRRGQTLPEMALSWVLGHECVTSVIVGASSAGQLEQNLKALQAPKFEVEEIEELDAICGTRAQTSGKGFPD